MTLNRRQVIKAVLAAMAVVPILPAATIPKQDWVTLKITPAEAQALANIVCRIGGEPYKSDRGHIDTISSILWEQGYSSQCGNVIEHVSLDEQGNKQWNYNQIYLRNYDEYKHTFAAGPGRRFQHSPDLRYMRRQRDGVRG